MDHQNPSSRQQELCHTLLIELLAHQFCSPVKWTETQDLLLSELKTIKTVEVGPTETLTNMIKQTHSIVHRPYDIANSISREFLSLRRDRDEIYHGSEERTPEITSAPNRNPVTAAPARAASEARATRPIPVLKPDTPMTAVSISDECVRVHEVVIAIVSTALRKPANAVALHESIKALSRGRSTLQNEIVGDLGAEFGSLPDNAEELPLKDLTSTLQTNFDGSLGKCTKSLIDMLFSAKMPGGFNQAKVRTMLQVKGFGAGRQDAVMLMAVQTPPTARLSSEAEAKDFWSAIADAYSSSVGITPDSTLSRVDQAAFPPTVDSESLEELKKRSNGFYREMFGVYARHVGIDNRAVAEEIAQLKSDTRSLQEMLDLWYHEHGDRYASGIKPFFDKRKVRVYDSSWNWALQDLFKIYHEVRQESFSLESDEIARRRRHILNCSSKRLMNVLRHMIEKLKKQSFRLIAVELWFEDVLQQSGAALKQAPTYIADRALTAPNTYINAEGVVTFAETTFTHSRSTMSADINKVRNLEMVSMLKGTEPLLSTAHDSRSKPTTSSINLKYPSNPGHNLLQNSPDSPDPHPSKIQQRENGTWKNSEDLSAKYRDILNQATSTGLVFQDKNFLVTGGGPSSIGAKIVQSLLSGGARVIVASSSYTNATKIFQKMFSQWGARGSCLMIIPYNAGSSQDAAALVDYIYDLPDLGWDLDHIIPFAAVPETGNGIEISSHSELAHRMMLTNTLRLLGAVKRAKEARNITTRPAQVILPLSPNHGIFGGDGLYSESKLGLEGLLNKWHTEDWSEYLSVCGAIIGWTRGTGLMDDNNILAEGLERFNLKTFSQDEMALRIIGLMALPIVQANYLEPLLADLSGGLNLVPDIKEKMVTIRNELSEMSSSHRILAKEQEAESNASLAGMESAALPSFNKRANIKLDFPRLLDYESEIKQFSNLEGMIDLEKAVVVVGFGEIGPHGNSRTRWQMESQGHFTFEGIIEMAWMMGLIVYQTGKGPAYSGWIEKETGQPISDEGIKLKYEDHILEHSGLRSLDPRPIDGPDPASRQVLHEIDIQHDFAPFEVSKETAAELVRENGKKVHVELDTDNDTCMVTLLKGARVMVPKSLAFDRTVGGQVPTGWCAKTYGIADDIIDQVDPATLYALVCTAEALLSAGITDPYEFYKYIHVSQLGVCVGSGIGGTVSLQNIYKERFKGQPVQNDILAESFINTGSAWINMLLLSSCGPNITPVGACATALESLDVGVEVITSGKAKAVFVGGYDSLTKDIAHEFANMKATISSKEEFNHGRAAEEMSRPTTSTRNGFVESEGCGIQLLTSAKLALEMGLPIYGIIGLARTASDKAGRSLPAPGRGVINFSGASKSSFDSPLLNMSYRKRQIELQIRQVEVNKRLEIKNLNDEISRYKVDSIDFDLDAYRRFRLNEIVNDSQRQRSVILNNYGNEFWKRDSRISPIRGVLASWNLTVDDIQVASFHGTSTLKNDINECEVIQEQMNQLGRTEGNPVLGIFQKHLTGHPKAAAAAWMLNGALQAMDTRLIPGNKNADNIDESFEKFDHIGFPNETIHTSEDVRAMIISSFGFGQKGAQAIVIHPRYLFAASGKESYATYQAKVQRRHTQAYHHFLKSMMTNTVVQAKEHPPYSEEQETDFLTDPDARLPMEPEL